MQLTSHRRTFSAPAERLPTTSIDRCPPLKPQSPSDGRRGLRAERQRYHLIEEVGRGGMGVVYRAWDRRLQQSVAIKILSKEQTSLPQGAARLRREAEVGGCLRHPNLVANAGIATLEGAPALVMQYIPGRTLRQLVQQHGPITPGSAIALLMQTLSGLAFAHQQGVVHGDIKPSNLMLGSDGVLRILDFGVARRIHAGHEPAEIDTGMPIASVDFLAPEQARPGAAPDPRSDIYSLGCTLHYLLTAKPMYPRRSAAARILAHRRQPIPSLCHACPHLPAAVETAFHNMVAKSPCDRYPTVDAILAALADLRFESDVNRADLQRLIATCNTHSHGVLAPTAIAAQALWSSEDDTCPLAPTDTT